MLHTLILQVFRNAIGFNFSHSVPYLKQQMYHGSALLSLSCWIVNIYYQTSFIKTLTKCAYFGSLNSHVRKKYINNSYSVSLKIQIQDSYNPNKPKFQKIMSSTFLKTTVVLLGLLFLGTSIIDRTYYIYLGLDISASQSDIQKAYQQKKQKIQGLEDQQAKSKKLKLLEQAYKVLGNQGKRKDYDRFNRDLIKKEKVMSNAQKINTENHRKDRTIKLTLPVSVEDIYHGKTVQTKVIRKEACQKCRGTGADSPSSLKTCPKCGGQGFSIQQTMNNYGQKFISQNTCDTCQGWGKKVTKICPVCHGSKIIEKLSNVDIKIPEGLPDGNIIRIANFGDQPITGAPSDLQVTIIQIPTEKWSRNNNDLIYRMEISLKQSILGFSKNFKHLNGQQVTISRNQVTHKDTIITQPDLGIKNPKTGKIGNLIIKFKIVMENFTDRQLDMWEDFFEEHNL